MRAGINISIKQRIYGSFALLVFLFVINGIITILTINSNKKLSRHLSEVIDPSIQVLNRFRNMLTESKIYTTYWVFLRADQNDKELLEKLHDSGYVKLKSKINFYAAQWKNKNWVDSLNEVFTGFEQLLTIEKNIMSSLKKFSDYDDPVIKLEAERVVEEEILPRTAALVNSLNEIHALAEIIKQDENTKLGISSMELRWFIILLAITIICAGFFLSLYMTKIIIRPVNTIRNIINNLGLGIIQKIDQHANNNEIGKMVRSVNNLSEKLQATATFAQEVGLRNFDMPFKPLSEEDTLGKALIAMRDNIKSSDEKLNIAQHIANIGSWERNIKTDKLTLSDEMFKIFDIDPLSFDFLFPSILKLIHADDIEYTMGMIRKNHYMVPVPFECRLVTSKGVIKNVVIETQLVLGTTGEIEKTFGIVQDITGRKKAEEQIRLSNERYELVIRTTNDMIWDWDLVSNTIFRNENYSKVFGTDAGDRNEIGKWIRHVHPDDTESIEKDMWKKLNDPDAESWEAEFRYYRHNNEMVYLHDRAFIIRDENKKAIRMVGATSDITERKKAEEGNRFKAELLNTVGQAVIATDMNGIVNFWNKAATEIYGWTTEEAIGKNIINLTPAEQSMEQAAEIMHELSLGHSWAGELILQHKNGRTFPAFVTDAPVYDQYHNLSGIIGVSSDITERKKAEEALSNNELRFRTLTSSAPVGIFQTDLEGKTIYVNETWLDYTGMSFKEAMGDGWISSVHPAEREMMIKRWSDKSAKGAESSSEYRLLDKKGNTRWVMGKAVPIFNKSGELLGHIGTVSDITERKLAIESLQQSEMKYRQIVETAQEGIWMIDENNYTIFVNKKMSQMLEYSQEEMLGKQNYYFKDEEEKKTAAVQIEKRKKGISETHDAKFVTKSGKVVWASVSTNPVFDDAGIYKGALGMMTNITRRKHDEELLHQSKITLAVKNKELESKNKELEQFAYVASHDMQEPLRTTSSFVELLQQQYHGRLDEKADKYLSFILQSSDRMKVLIKDLLDYSRIGKKRELKQVDCKEVLAEVLADLDLAIKETQATIAAEPLPVIDGYPTEIKQLFQNLIMNAVKFRKKTIAPQIKISVQKLKDQWEFAIKDNGIGIDEQHGERIFIIFQRLHTRTEYEGSGIGLAHCKKIVELHNGKIWFTSKPGEGTTFYFTIPQNSN